MNAKTKADPTAHPQVAAPEASDNTEAWESGALGCDPAHAVAVPDDGSVDRALGLVVMSTRVKKKQGKQMEKAAKKAGLCLKAWLRQALIEKLDSSKSPKKKRKQKK
ncbi:MAG: hypothetical protein WC028_30965 [Candidatus Obscuribacterales bacterium]|jgi:hypothetical protein